MPTRKLFLLFLTFPTICYADGLTGLGEALAEAIMLGLSVVALLNIVALWVSFTRLTTFKRVLIVLALLSTVAAAVFIIYQVPDMLAHYREATGWTTEVPEIRVKLDREVADIKADITWGTVVLLVCICLSCCYVYVLVKKRNKPTN